MFSAGQNINNISLLLIAFTNSFLILSINYELRLAAFIFFLGYIIIFPGLALLSPGKIIQNKRYLALILLFITAVFLFLLFFQFDAAGTLSAVVFISYTGYLIKDSENGTGMIIRTLMFISAPILFIEIIYGGSHVSAVLLLVLIFYLQNRVASERINITFIFLSVLTGAVMIISPLLLIPFAPLALHVFRNKLGQLMFMVLLAGIIFISASWYVSEGMLYEYLVVYFSEDIPKIQFWIWLPYFVLLFIVSWITADMQEVFFVSGISLFIPFLILLIFNLVNSGIDGIRAFSYLEMLQISVPLLISSIRDRKVLLFTGITVPPS